jgi:protein subunit release factor B
MLRPTNTVQETQFFSTITKESIKELEEESNRNNHNEEYTQHQQQQVINSRRQQPKHPLRTRKREPPGKK